MTPLADAQLAALDRAAAIGFAREAPAVPEPLRDPLALLAFAAHQRRLTELPARSPARVDRVEAPSDDRPVLPEPARQRLRSLVRAAKKLRSEALLVPVAQVLRAKGWRLHPFDTDLLAPLRLAAGPYEFWLAEKAGVDLGDSTVAAEVDDSAWTTLPPAQRAAWLRRRRHADPDAARALLEAAWASERAEVRLRLLASLVVRLGPADAPFLLGLTSDRSTHVRELGARLAALAGGVLTDDRFAAWLISAVEIARIAFVGPKGASIRSGIDVDAAFDAIASRPLATSLAALGTTVDVLVASTGIAPLLPAFALGALIAGATAAHRTLLEAALRHGWDPNAGHWRANVLQVPRETRLAALEPLAVSLVPAIAASLASPGPWLALLDGPLPVAASRSLRDSEPWRKLLDALREPGDEAKEVAALAAVAGFVHPADARAAVAQLDAAGASAPALVRLTWNLLADLEGAP